MAGTSTQRQPAFILQTYAFLWDGCDLISVVSEVFIVDGILKECPCGLDLMDMPLTSSGMVFEESTSGLYSMLNARMTKLGYRIPGPLRQVGNHFPVQAQNTPIIYTDMIEGVLIREFGETIVYGSGSADGFRKLLSRMPPKAISVKKSDNNDDQKAGRAIRISSDGQMGEMDENDKFLERFLPK